MENAHAFNEERRLDHRSFQIVRPGAQQAKTRDILYTIGIRFVLPEKCAVPVPIALESPRVALPKRSKKPRKSVAKQ